MIMTVLAQIEPGNPAANGAVDGAAQAAAGALPTLLDLTIKGGPVMIPIGICSLLALAITVERGVKLRRSNVIPAGFLDGLRGVLKDPVRDRAAALEYCKKNDGPVGRVFSAGIRRLGAGEERLKTAVQEAGEREVPALRARLRMLSVIASVAPLLGLLGTITGMITSFQTVAGSADALGRTELLAGGIYEAMVTTAAGLIVAIPTLLVHHWLSARVESLVARIDAMTVEFIEEFELEAVSNPPAKAGPRITEAPPASIDGQAWREPAPASV